MSRYQYFFLLLFAAKALVSPLPAWAISDTAFSNMSEGSFILAILLFPFLGLAIPLLISWTTYRMLQRRQPHYEAPLLPILTASFLTQLVGSQIMNFVIINFAMDAVWALLFNVGFIIGATVLAWNFTRKPLPE